MTDYRFNVPPNWPPAPPNWKPPQGWTPDPSWGPAPQGWEFWVLDETSKKPVQQNQGQNTKPSELSRNSSALPPRREKDTAVPQNLTPVSSADYSDEKITIFNAKKVAQALQGENGSLRLQVAELKSALSDLGGLEYAEVQKRIAYEKENWLQESSAQRLSLEQEVRSQRENLERQRHEQEQRLTKEQEKHVNELRNSQTFAESKLSQINRRVDEETQKYENLRHTIIDMTELVALQENGLYEYRHPAQNSLQYKDKLDKVKTQIKEACKGKGEGAISRSTTFTFNNSAAQGRKFVDDFARLMLRAYNAEAENCMTMLKAGNIDRAIERLSKAEDNIEKLGKMLSIEVIDSYHYLRVKELELTSDYLQMVKDEKEREKEIAEKLREERKVEQEIAAAKAKVEKERQHYIMNMEKLKQRLASVSDPSEEAEVRANLEEMQASLGQADDKMEDVLNREANMRAGTVYVISNLGSFGKGIVKVGMTRRLDPMERIKELSGTSVPFPFDVHLLQASDDAVALETALHRHLEKRKVNWIRRREFFYATPEEIRDILRGSEFKGAVVSYTADSTAEEYNQSMRYTAANGYEDVARQRLA